MFVRPLKLIEDGAVGRVVVRTERIIRVGGVAEIDVVVDVNTVTDVVGTVCIAKNTERYSETVFAAVRCKVGNVSVVALDLRAREVLAVGLVKVRDVLVLGTGVVLGAAFVEHNLHLLPLLVDVIAAVSVVVLVVVELAHVLVVRELLECHLRHDLLLESTAPAIVAILLLLDISVVVTVVVGPVAVLVVVVSVVPLRVDERIQISGQIIFLECLCKNKASELTSPAY